MTTIVVDLMKGEVFADSRLYHKSKEEVMSEGKVKIFRSKKHDRIYFGTGVAHAITLAIHEMESDCFVCMPNNLSTVGYIEKAVSGFVMKVHRSERNPWYKRLFKGEYAPECAVSTQYNIIAGIAVYGSGFDYARYAIDTLGISPADAIRYAASKDSMTNNIIHKLKL